jgi:hypothetical protein
MRRPPKDAQPNDCVVVTDVVPDHEKALAGIAIINPLRWSKSIVVALVLLQSRHVRRASFSSQPLPCAMT